MWDILPFVLLPQEERALFSLRYYLDKFQHFQQVLPLLSVCGWNVLLPQHDHSLTGAERTPCTVLYEPLLSLVCLTPLCHSPMPWERC